MALGCGRRKGRVGGHLAPEAALDADHQLADRLAGDDAHARLQVLAVAHDGRPGHRELAGLVLQPHARRRGRRPARQAERHHAAEDGERPGTGSESRLPRCEMAFFDAQRGPGVTGLGRHGRCGVGATACSSNRRAREACAHAGRRHRRAGAVQGRREWRGARPGQERQVPGTRGAVRAAVSTGRLTLPGVPHKLAAILRRHRGSPRVAVLVTATPHSAMPTSRPPASPAGPVSDATGDPSSRSRPSTISSPTPSQALIDDLARAPGDIMILGVAGKMGPTLARLARRAAPERRVIGVARFSEKGVQERSQAHGVETIAADLLDRAAIDALPRVPNVVFAAGHKFGATGNPGLTWAMNALVPALVAESFRDVAHRRLLDRQRLPAEHDRPARGERGDAGRPGRRVRAELRRARAHVRVLLDEVRHAGPDLPPQLRDRHALRRARRHRRQDQARPGRST